MTSNLSSADPPSSAPNSFNPARQHGGASAAPTIPPAARGRR